MQTDDDLTQNLSAAFRDGTHDLTYGGRRRPRRVAAAVAVPVTAFAIAAVGLTVAHQGADPQRPPATVASAPTSQKAQENVTDTISMSGFSFKVTRAAGAASPVYATRVDAVPDGLKPVDAPAGAKAWVGKDPQGNNALYVRPENGQLFALHSSQWSQDQLVAMFQEPTPVPLVEE